MPWISVSQARRKVNNAVSHQAILRLIHRGKVKATRIGAKYLLDEADFDRYVAEGIFKVISGPNHRSRS